MIRSSIVVALMFICMQVTAQKDKQQIEGAIEGFFNGLSLLNADTVKNYSTSDFHLLEDGEVWTLDTLILKLNPRNNADIKRINHFRFIRIEQKNNTAWVSYFNTAEFRLGEKKQTVKWLESAVLIKNKGRWLIQLLHSTELKPEKPD